MKVYTLRHTYEYMTLFTMWPSTTRKNNFKENKNKQQQLLSIHTYIYTNRQTLNSKFLKQYTYTCTFI